MGQVHFGCKTNCIVKPFYGLREPGENACRAFNRRQSRSGHNDRLFQLHDMEFMLACDAFMAFMFTFDAILQFRAHWWQ